MRWPFGRKEPPRFCRNDGCELKEMTFNEGAPVYDERTGLGVQKKRVYLACTNIKWDNGDQWIYHTLRPIREYYVETPPCP